MNDRAVDFREKTNERWTSFLGLQRKKTLASNDELCMEGHVSFFHTISTFRVNPVGRELYAWRPIGNRR